MPNSISVHPDLPAPPAPRRWAPHYALLFVVSLLAGLLYLREPGFGDELTYWSLAFDLHDIGVAGWNVGSFHDLRWPVWGMSWLSQFVFGPGLASFYSGPLLYLAAGAALAFTFGRHAVRTAGGAWACAVALLFAPVIDLVVYRPIPDLSDSVYGGCALLAWWTMMRADAPRRAWLPGVLSGIAIGIGYSNRVTGLFITPVLAVATLLFFPRRWAWLLLPAAVSALFFATEGAVYQAVCGDFWHSIHANLGGAGAKDVEVTPLWFLPFRYVKLLFHGNRLAPIYTLLAALGGWAAWRRHGLAGRLVVVWFSVLFLEYSCIIQSLHPVRPLLGSTARYLGAVALPMSVLTAIGALELWRLLEWKLPRLTARLTSHRALALAGLILFLALYSTRPFFDLGFTTELSRYMDKLPAGTKVFTHHLMRDAAFLADSRAARRFEWHAPRAIITRTPELEKTAAASDQFWYLRKQVWLVERKRVEHNSALAQPPLGSYLETPEREWALREVLAKGDATDIVMFARRSANAPPPLILTATSPELAGFAPATLPVAWNAQNSPKLVWLKWNVPPALRGKLVEVHTEGSSTTVEPLNVRVEFIAKKRRGAEIVFKPIFFKSGGQDFFALKIPKEAERCEVQLKYNKSASHVQLTNFRAVFDDAP